MKLSLDFVLIVSVVTLTYYLDFQCPSAKIKINYQSLRLCRYHLQLAPIMQIFAFLLMMIKKKKNYGGMLQMDR